MEEKCSQEIINFVFKIEEISEKNFEKDFLLKDVAMRKTGQNTYQINHSEKSTERQMYALIRSSTIIPDDVFIPTSMKHKVKVLRRMRFVDDEVDYGDFLSNVYLIRITLKCHESIPIYLTCHDPYFLQEHYVIYKTEHRKEYKVTKQLQTFIYIDEHNKDEYISLSKLC